MKKTKRLYEAEGKKEATLCWVPKWGPVFAGPDGTDKGGVAELNKQLWEMMKDFKGEWKEFHKKALEMAKEAGWTVKGDFYEDKVDEALSDKELDEFVAALKKGVVNFEFEKVDGTVRKAKGTLNQDLMKVPEKKVDGAAKKRFMPPTIQVFWDVEKEEFRSCRKASIIKWEAEEKDDGDKED